MKKYLIATWLTVFLFQNANACDMCGGGVNNLNPYLFPHLSRSYVGVSYLHHHYSQLVDGSNTHQYNNALVFLGQFSIKNRLQVQALLPFQFNSITSEWNTVSRRGVGDVTLMASYTAWQASIGKTNQSVSVGGGVKLPTGKYSSTKIEEGNDQNFQLGSGATDYLLNAAYRFNIGNFAINTLGAYKFTTANEDGYRFGDVLTTRATALYQVRRKEISYAPYLQVISEQHYRDADQHVLQNHSGGEVLYAGAGMDITANAITFGVNYQVAASQNLLGGELRAHPKFSARLSFTL